MAISNLPGITGRAITSGSEQKQNSNAGKGDILDSGAIALKNSMKAAKLNVDQAAETTDFSAYTDELSANSAFTRKFGKKTDESESTQGFERILEEDPAPKAKKIVQVAGFQDLSLQDLLKQVRGLFPDDSDLVMVLRELLRREDIDPIKKKRIAEVLKMVEAEAEPKTLKAGINCALKARLFGKMLALSPLLLRASYRHFLESDASEIISYEEWCTTYGYKKRKTLVDFLEEALLTDIDSQDPSCSHLEFGSLLNKLNKLKLLRSADELFIERLLNDALMRDYNNKEEDWLTFMLMLIQFPQELDSLLLATLGETIFLQPHKKRGALLQLVFSTCKNLPLELFADINLTHELFEHFQHLLSIAYSNEIIEKRKKPILIIESESDLKTNANNWSDQ